MHPPLLEALAATPDDAETWDVLADWLEERGDARAAWMRLTRDVPLPNPVHAGAYLAALQAAERAWFGDLDVRELGLVWRHGFVELAHLMPKHAALLRHPALRFVRELNLSGFDEVTLPPRHQLRALRCDGAKALPALPPLELLVLLNGAPALTGERPARCVVRARADVELHVRPRYGLVNFRALPAELPAEGDGSDEWRATSRSFGSGISDPHRLLRACGACDGADLAQIFDGFWKFKDSDASKWLTWREEVWCRDCGAFTFLERHEED